MKEVTQVTQNHHSIANPFPITTPITHAKYTIIDYSQLQFLHPRLIRVVRLHKRQPNFTTPASTYRSTMCLMCNRIRDTVDETWREHIPLSPSTAPKQQMAHGSGSGGHKLNIIGFKPFTTCNQTK